MAEIIDLYTVDREHTGKTAKRGEPLEDGTYRMWSMYASSTAKARC